jgi:hypothetical protein
MGSWVAGRFRHVIGETIVIVAPEESRLNSAVGFNAGHRRELEALVVIEKEKRGGDTGLLQNVRFEMRAPDVARTGGRVGGASVNCEAGQRQAQYHGRNAFK